MEFGEWEPIDETELDAIEASFLSSSCKRKNLSCIEKDAADAAETNRSRPKGRRLPNWGAAASGSDVDRASGSSDGGGVPRGIAGKSLACGACPNNGTWNLARPSCRAQLKVRYPLMTFGGHIVYCRTALEVERAMIELLETIKSNKQNGDPIYVGFDIEWRPTFKRGVAPRKAAVIQLCVDNSNCYVMHVIHFGIPPILQSFLEDNSSIKVGICIANDAMKILRDYNVRVEALEDLSGLANLKLGGTPRKWSLCSLTEMVTCKQLAKPNKIRMGNWEADVLSKEQLLYAATDAFVSWYLYQALKSFPSATSREEKMEQVACAESS